MEKNFLFFSIVFLLYFFLQSYCGRNYYDILGVDKKADIKTIKQAYRKLAIKFHPDRHTTKEAKEEATTKFSEIAHAYEILSDEKNRKIYDMYGEEGLTRGSHGGGGFGFMDPSSIFRNFFGEDSGFQFSFGGGFGDESETFEEEENFKGEDMVIPLTVSLEDIYLGKVLTYNRIRSAHPKGSKPKPCSCRSNVVKITVVNGQMKKMKETNCPECKNRFGVIQKRKELLVDIQAGMKEGTKITFRGEGDASQSKTAGDLTFIINSAPHKIFVRDSQHLRMNMRISLKEALTGFSRTIKHLDDRDVSIKIDKIIKPGHIERIVGEGMPLENKEEKGDLFITFDVDFPVSLSEEQKNKLREAL